jgi:hypothetical protein
LAVLSTVYLAQRTGVRCVASFGHHTVPPYR